MTTIHPDAQAFIDDAIAYLRQRGAEVGDFGRFYLYLDDERAWEIEETGSSLPDAGADAYNRALVSLYADWRREMGEERWHELLAYNHSLNGANYNGLLPEMDEMMAHYGVSL
jgi:hypothetical protein